MARPIKKGLDYFPYDCNHDRKIKMLLRKYGLEGEGLYINLLKLIYSNGYYVELPNDVIEDICFECMIEKDLFLQILDFLIDKGFFSKTLYEQEGVLSSHGVQKRFLEATKRRKENNKCDIFELNERNSLVNVNNNPAQEEFLQHNDALGGVNVDNGTQSKVNKRKGNNSKEEKKESLYSFEDWWDAYDRKVDKKKAEAKWNSLDESDKKTCMEVVGDYVKSTPDERASGGGWFRLKPYKYLSQGQWNERVVLPQEEEDPWAVADSGDALAVMAMVKRKGLAP